MRLVGRGEMIARDDGGLTAAWVPRARPGRRGLCRGPGQAPGGAAARGTAGPGPGEAASVRAGGLGSPGGLGPLTWVLWPRCLLCPSCPWAAWAVPEASVLPSRESKELADLARLHPTSCAPNGLNPNLMVTGGPALAGSGRWSADPTAHLATHPWLPRSGSTSMWLAGHPYGERGGRDCLPVWGEWQGPR